MTQWQIIVTEYDENDEQVEYLYLFDTWAEVVKRLADFDGLSPSYLILHVSKERE